MKVKVLIKQTNEGLQAFVVQEGRQGVNLIKRRCCNSLGLAKTEIITNPRLRGCEIEYELVGVEE